MKNIYKKLANIQAMGLSFQKTADNPFFKSKYTPLEDILKKLNPILDKEGLIIYHSSSGQSVDTRAVDTESGEYIESHFTIKQDLKPQEIGSTITYGKRYNIGMIFNIITDEDDDANASVNYGKETKKISVFEQAMKIIKAEKDKSKLEEWKKKIETSAKYSEDEKFELITLISEK